MMKKILVLGDDIKAKWHPLANVLEQLRLILPDYCLDATDDYTVLESKALSQYNIVISYLEYTDTKISSGQAAALLSYILQGGGFMALHNGISLQSNAEMAQAMGAKFTKHDKYDTLPTLEYKILPIQHPITDGINDFCLLEEPYEYIFDNFSAHDILAEYVYKGKRFAAIWVKSYGQGRIVCLAPGHNSLVFENSELAKLVKNCALWLNNQT